MEGNNSAPPRHRFEREGIQGLMIASGDEDPHIRQMAALFLGAVGDASSLSRLIRLLGDPDKGVRERALHAVVRAGPPAVGPLIEALKDENWIVRYRAAEGLGRIGDPRAIEPLIGLLNDSKDHVRYMAAKGLGLIPDSRSVAPLIRTLEDPNIYVQSRSAIALGEIGGHAACDALQRAIEGMDSMDTREIFVRAADRACRGNAP